MIAQRELAALRAEWSLSQDVIEKDYVLGWLLAGIAQHPELRDRWVFKGGTCLRKCYYETYRFSEDLDFTVVDEGPEDPADLARIFTDVAAWVARESGIDMVVDHRSFRRARNRRGHPTTQGKVGYRGPNASPTVPKVKIDLTSDEVLASRPERRPIAHPYSDALPGGTVRCYSIAELFGEKLRALAERCRPRDLYDVVHLHRHPDLVGSAPAVRQALAHKCCHAGIAVPTLQTIHASPSRTEIETEWASMLAHQLPQPLVPFQVFWDALDDVFAWLDGAPSPQLPRAQSSTVDTWQAPQAIASWQQRFPLELLRYAGANRLKVEIDYRAEQGRQGPRTVEPYSLRRTNDGHLVLFVANDRGQLRSYRVDHIAAVRITATPFTPRYRIEF